MKNFGRSLRKNCPYSELFWSAFSRIQTEYWEIRSISLHSVRMLENANQNNSEYRLFSRSRFFYKLGAFVKGFHISITVILIFNVLIFIFLPHSAWFLQIFWLMVNFCQLYLTYCVLWHRLFGIFRDGRSLNPKLFCFCVKTILDFFLVKP